MTTTENKDIPTEDESRNTWFTLWEFAQREISWCEGVIDFDSFFESGKEKFEIKIKEINNEQK